MPSAPVSSSSATSATGSSGTYSHATGRQQTIASTANSTMLCRKKCTSMLPTAASGRISRGNETFFTSPALATTEPSARAEPGREQVPHEQARQQEDRERRDAASRGSSERDVEDDQVEQRVQQRPREAQDAVLVLDLQLLARHPDEQLAVRDDPPKALDHGGARSNDACVAHGPFGACTGVWHTRQVSRRVAFPGSGRRCDTRSRARTGRWSDGVIGSTSPHTTVDVVADEHVIDLAVRGAPPDTCVRATARRQPGNTATTPAGPRS